MNIARYVGSDAIERAGSVITIIGAALLVAWLFGETRLDDWIRSSYSRSSYLDDMFCLSRCYHDGVRWGWRLIAVGLVVRVLVKPAWRWLKTGSVRQD